LVFGAIDVGIMLPMSFPDKRTAIAAAFIARFGIGSSLARLACLGPDGRSASASACY
jgi:hypothetical protein